MRSHATRLCCRALCGAITVTVLVTTGCAPQPREPDEQGATAAVIEPDEAALWARRVTSLADWQSWRVRGKVAYRLPEDAGSANLSWQQLRDDAILRLSGPLGTGSTRISNEGALLRVRRDGIERLYPADAAPWLPGNRLLPVPIDSIQHWLRGLPDPRLPIDELTRRDALARSIEQAGWRISYADYRDYRGLPMPARLQLTAPDRELNLTLILRAWERQDAQAAPVNDTGEPGAGASRKK